MSRNYSKKEKNLGFVIANISDGQICMSTNVPSQQSMSFEEGEKSTRFSQRVGKFAQEIFLQGEETGDDANPVDVAPKMKCLSKWTQIVNQGGMTFSCSNC